MTDENVLLQYKDEFFGRFISIKPKTFADLKPFRKTKFPYYMDPEYDKKENDYSALFIPPTYPSNGIVTPIVNSIWNNMVVTPQRSYTPGLFGGSFFDIVKNPETGMKKEVPKRLPIIKHGEFILKHKLIKSTEQKIFELLCIFPPDVVVPGNMRMFNYFGFADWFEPFSAPEAEIQDFIKNYKSKIVRKY